MAYLGLRTCCYAVSNIEEAKAWYTKVFDCEPYFDQPFYVGFNIKGFELGLSPRESYALKKEESVYTYWGVENVEKEFNRLLDLGAKAHEKPKDVGEGILLASVYDPWGNILGIIYNPNFKL